MCLLSLAVLLIGCKEATVTPLPPPSLAFTSLAAGGYHSLALDERGHAWSWGWNEYGQLADGGTTGRGAPVSVLAAEGTSIAAVAAGGLYSFLLDADGNTWAAGFNEDGQLGDGTTAGRTLPVRVEVPAGVSLTSVAAGDFHTVALDVDGNAWAWGFNDDGQLGDRSTASRASPVRVNLPDGVALTCVAAGGLHSLALDADGNAWAWGFNRDGQLGDATITRRTTPVEVAMPEGVTFTSLVAGERHSIALDEHGNAWTWGSNVYGQLGDGTAFRRTTPVRVTMPALVRFVAVAAGGQHSVALDQYGNVWGWGRNDQGQLGDTTTFNRFSPSQAYLPAGVTFTVIAAGYQHSLALDEHGNGWGWGRNVAGQLGIGNLEEQRSPVVVAMP